jgi:hypothetical protein
VANDQEDELMKWAVEIQKTGLEHRNLVDLLHGLGFQLVDGVDFEALYSPHFDDLGSAAEVWAEAKKVRNAFTGPASIDPELILGAVIDYSAGERKRHAFLEVDSIHTKMTLGSPTLTELPPPNLSPEELKEWEDKRAEQNYQAKLESQMGKLEPVFLEPRAAKVLELLSKENQTGVTLFKIYEIMEISHLNRKNFQQQFNISIYEFRRFGDAVHNRRVSGDLARHANEDPPKTSNPMTISEAETFIRRLVKEWLASIRNNKR